MRVRGSGSLWFRTERDLERDTDRERERERGRERECDEMVRMRPSDACPSVSWSVEKPRIPCPGERDRR